MAFTDKILQYTGSNTGLNIPDAIKQAIDNTLGIVKARAPQLLPLFARKMTVSDLPDAGYNLSSKNVFDVHKVERESGTTLYICQPVPSEQAHAVSDSKSIYYAQSYSPVYVIDFESNLKIYPVGNDTDKAYMYLIYNSDSKTVSDSAETIIDVTENANADGADGYTGAQHFPKVWYQYIILQASSILVQQKISLFLSDSSNASITSIEEWLADEDEGMVASTSQAIQLFQSKLSVIDKYKQEFLMSQGISGTSDDPKLGQKS